MPAKKSEKPPLRPFAKDPDPPARPVELPAEVPNIQTEDGIKPLIAERGLFGFRPVGLRRGGVVRLYKFNDGTLASAVASPATLKPRDLAEIAALLISPDYAIPRTTAEEKK